MRGGLGGRGLRGGLGAVDSTDDTGQEWASHRIAAAALTAEGEAVFPVGSGFATTAAAPPTAVALSQIPAPRNSSGGAGAQRLIALPEVFPQNARITRVVQIFDVSPTAPADATFEIGIYSSLRTGTPQPATRLWTSGTIDLSALAGVGATLAEFKPTGGIYTPAGTLLWFCSVFSTPAAQASPNYCRALCSGDRNWPAILGYVLQSSAQLFNAPASTYASPKGHFGWSIPLVAATLPSSAPTPDPVEHRLTNANDSYLPTPFYSLAYA